MDEDEKLELKNLLESQSKNILSKLQDPMIKMSQEEFNLKIKDQVGNVINRWLTILGVTNIALALGIIYSIFVKVPQIAVEASEKKLETKADAIVDKAQNKIEGHVNEFFRKYGEARSDLKKVSSDIEITREQVLQADDNIQEISGKIPSYEGKLSEIKQKLNELESSYLDNAQVKQLSELIDQLNARDDEIGALSKITSDLREIKQKQNHLLSKPKWIEAQLWPEWENYNEIQQSVAYMKKQNVVYIKGLVKRKSSTGRDGTVFRLPIDMRPKKRMHFVIASSKENAVFIYVNADGQVIVRGFDSGWLSFDSINFALGEDE